MDNYCWNTLKLMFAISRSYELSCYCCCCCFCCFVVMLLLLLFLLLCYWSKNQCKHWNFIFIFFKRRENSTHNSWKICSPSTLSHSWNLSGGNPFLTQCSLLWVKVQNIYSDVTMSPLFSLFIFHCFINDITMVTNSLHF